MIIAIKIKLKPTKEQEVLFWKSAGVARGAYNYFLSESERYYNENLKGVKETEVKKHMNNVLKKTTHTWLKEVGSNVMKQGVKDANLARERWFKGISEKPRYKSRRKSKISFYINYESLKKVKGGFRGEKIGFVKTCQALPKLNSSKKCSYCGAIKKDLKLKDRIYKCSCGFKLDRDLNAAINLANYSIQSA